MANKVKYPKAQFRLPRGRYVRGSFTKMTTTDHKKQPLPPEKHHFWVAIAVEKTAPGLGDVLNGIMQHTWQTYSAVAGNQAVMQQLQAGYAAQSFSWKITDADTDAVWSKREGCQGCWIFEMRSYQGMNLYDGLNRQLDAECFQPGDFVDAFITTEINGETDTRVAGIYVNPLVIRWLDHGPRINIGVDAATLFGDTVGTGYTAPQAGPGPTHLVGGPANQPPTYGQQPVHQPAPPPPPAPAPQQPAETDEQWNIRHTGQAAPGYRFNPQTNAWDPASAPTYAPASATGQYNQAGNFGVSVPAVPAGAPGPIVHSAGQQPPQGTAYPSNQYGPGNPPPGVQQQNYAGGPPRY